MQTARDFSVSYIDPTTAAWLRTALNAQDLITNGKLEDYYYELYWYSLNRAARANSDLPLVGRVADGPEHDYPDELDRTGRDNMEAAEKMQALMDSINALPQLQRDIIHMHYFQEVSLTEIGSQLGVSATHASLLHRRALSRLRLSQDEPISNVEIIKITSKATQPKQSYRNLAEEALRRFEECRRASNSLTQQESD